MSGQSPNLLFAGVTLCSRRCLLVFAESLSKLFENFFVGVRSIGLSERHRSALSFDRGTDVAVAEECSRERVGDCRILLARLFVGSTNRLQSERLKIGGRRGLSIRVHQIPGDGVEHFRVVRQRAVNQFAAFGQS